MRPLRCLAFLIVLLGSVTLDLKSQPITGQEISVQNDLPTFNYNAPVYFFKGPDSTYWFTNESKVHSFSFITSQWTSHNYPNVDNKSLRPGYNETINEFYLWSPGAGSMYTWDPYTGSSELLGDSTEFKNQFGHTPVMLPELNKIALFGGYGYWQYQNALTFFDFSTKEWSSISSPSSDSLYPFPRTDAMITLNSLKTQLHMTGGFSTESGRDDVLNEDIRYLNDYWIFDLERLTWTRYPVLGDLFYFSSRTLRPNPPFIQTNWGDFDSKHGQALFIHRIEDQNGRFGLIIFNEEFKQAVPLSMGLESGFRNVALLGFDYLENTRQILAFWVPLKGEGDSLNIVVKIHTLPPQEQILAEIRKMVDQDKQTKIIESQISIFLRLFLLTSILLVLFLVYKYFLPRFFNKNLSPHQLKLFYSKEPQIYFNDQNISSVLAHTTQYLLLWMHWKHLSGTEYVITDEIESRFVDDSTNLDYSRKKRNALLKRFHDDFDSILKNNHDVSLRIRDRVHPDDKRKRDYFIITQGIEVRSDIDNYFTIGEASNDQNNPFEPIDLTYLLKDINQIWAEDIRRSVQSRSNELI